MACCTFEMWHLTVCTAASCSCAQVLLDTKVFVKDYGGPFRRPASQLPPLLLPPPPPPLSAPDPEPAALMLPPPPPPLRSGPPYTAPLVSPEPASAPLPAVLLAPSSGDTAVPVVRGRAAEEGAPGMEVEVADAVEPEEEEVEEGPAAGSVELGPGPTLRLRIQVIAAGQ